MIYVVLFGSFLAYCSSGISPRYGVFWAFLSWTIPFWGILLCLFFLIYVGLSLKSSSFPLRGLRGFLLGICILGYVPFFWATYRPFSSPALPSPLPPDALSVLSYNVRVFNSYQLLEAEKPHSSMTLPAWVGRQEATVKCLQEFYHLGGSPKFDMIQQSHAKGYHLHTGAPENLHDAGGFFGVAILSKLPFIAKGELPFKLPHKDYRLAIWADILHQNDTIRIINVHLEPFILAGKLDLAHLLPALARGFEARAKQVEYIADFIAKTPHRVILAGDFNDLPYSYTYQAFKRQLSNAFEVCGTGFGFTHAGFGGLSALRIDNQFFGKGLKCLAYHVYNNQTDSDHLPILGVYQK